MSLGGGGAGVPRVAPDAEADAKALADGTGSEGGRGVEGNAALGSREIGGGAPLCVTGGPVVSESLSRPNMASPRPRPTTPTPNKTSATCEARKLLGRAAFSGGE